MKVGRSQSITIGRGPE